MNSFLIHVLYSWWRWLVSFNINVVEYSITEQLPLEGLSCLTCLRTLSRKLLDTSKDGGVYPVLVLNHPDTEKAFPDVQMEAPVIQLMCIASCPITGTTRHLWAPLNAWDFVLLPRMETLQLPWATYSGAQSAQSKKKALLMRTVLHLSLSPLPLPVIGHHQEDSGFISLQPAFRYLHTFKRAPRVFP